MADDTQYVNSIQVKNEVYNIQDKPLTDMISNLIINTEYSSLPIITNRLVYSDLISLKSASINNIFNLFFSVGTCITEGANPHKQVNVNSITSKPVSGTTILVQFVYGHFANSMTLSINSYTENYRVCALNTDGIELQEGSIKANSWVLLTFHNDIWWAHTPVIKDYNGIQKFIWSDTTQDDNENE